MYEKESLNVMNMHKVCIEAGRKMKQQQLNFTLKLILNEGNESMEIQKKDNLNATSIQREFFSNF